MFEDSLEFCFDGDKIVKIKLSEGMTLDKCSYLAFDCVDGS